MKTLQEAWSEFAAGIIPPNAPPMQREEMKKAFYGGAWIILSMMLNEIGPESVSEDEGMRRLQSWHDECHAFARSVK